MKKERFKSFILVLLLIASVFQVGILWSGSDYSFPFYYAASVFNPPQDNISAAYPDIPDVDADAKQILLNPYRVTLCDGEGHYVIPRKSEEFNDLKEISFLLFEDILNERAVRKDIGEEAWSALVSRKSILFEFKVPIAKEAIMWSIGFYSASSGAPDDVHKMLVIPKEGATVGLYALTSNGAVQYAPRSVSVSVMEKLFSETLSVIDIESVNVTKYATVSEFGANSYPGFRGDVLANIYGRKSTSFNTLMYTVPFFVRSAELSYMVLGDEINSYSRSNESDNNMMIFKNYSNVYRFNNHGIMEYSYIPSVQPQDKGDLFVALSNAMAFVQRIKNNLLSEPELYLSSMSQDETSYQFTFDYIYGDFVYGDYPVFFRHESRHMEETITQENAIVVSANSRRTLACSWAIVDMYFGSDSQNFQTAFDTINVTNISTMQVDDISIVYYFDMNSYMDQNNTAMPVWPVWRIEGTEGSAEYIPMSSDEGN